MNKLFFISFITLSGLHSCTFSAGKNNSIETIPEILVTRVTSRDTIVNTAYVAQLSAIQNTEIRSRVLVF